MDNRIEDIGYVLIADLTNNRWEVTIFDNDNRLIGDLDHKYETRGQAVDAADKWARDRGLFLVFGIGTLRRVVREHS